MPQMMPLSWLSLYIFFSAMLMLFTFLNYYSFIPQSVLLQKKNFSMKKLSWKW